MIPKMILLLVALLASVTVTFGQARTAERIQDVPHSLLNQGNPPNGSIRHDISGTPGTSPCAGGGTGALAIKIAGVWHCPRLSPGTGTGDTSGAASSSAGELVLFLDTSGKALGRSNSLNGIPFLISGVVSTLASTGTGNVARATSATLTSPTLLTPTIGAFNNAQHTHESAVGGGQLNASTVFSSGVIPPARIISGALTMNKCLRLSNVGQIEVAAEDCGTGSGGTPGGVSGNLTFNEAGAFGGIANSAYDSVTGRLTINQKADGNDTFYSQRATNTSPTGSFIKFRNSDGSADLFLVSVDGSVSLSNRLIAKNIAAPAVPSAGNTVVWSDLTDKNLKAQDDAGNVSITLRPMACSGTDKISSISSAGVVTCTADQGGSGTGVITLNALNTSDQTFVAVDDANIDLTIGSSVSTHTFTVAWVGALSKARQHGATAYVDAGNTWASGAQSFAAASSLLVPTSDGVAPTVNGSIAFDSLSNTLEYGENGTNRLVVNTSGSQTLDNKTLANSTTANLRDTLLTLQDNADPTKTANFELSGITSGTNRVVSIANAASTTVQPSAPTANQFVTNIDSAGVAQKAQPSFANLSGSMGETQGGTGQTSYVQGDILFASAANTLSKLPKSASATRYLANTGASNNPQWDLVNLANGVTGTLADGNLSANVSLLGSAIDLSGAEASGILAAARFPALTGDVTTSSGAVSTTIASDVVTNAKMANMATATFKGRTTAGTGDPEDLTATQATALLNNATTTLKGLVPAPGSATGAFLRDDLTWVTPAGAGDMVLAIPQTNTGAKTFNDGTFILNGGDYGAADGSMPTGVEKSFYLNTNASSRHLFIFNNGSYRQIFQAGVDAINLASANVSGVLPLANGGTNQTSWTAARCVRVNAGGTALEAAAADCGSGGGGSPGGSGSELQFRGGASTFSAVTGSSVSGGTVVLGHTAALGRLGQTFEVTTSANWGGVALSTFSTGVSESPMLDFNKSKSATKGTQTAVTSNDLLGVISFRGSDGTNFQDAAQILVEVDGAAGASDMPGRLSFRTTSDGAAVTTERWRITSAGHFMAGADNTYDIGASAATRPRNVFAGTEIQSPVFTATGSGAGYIELAEGAAPSAVANRVSVVAPTDVTAAGWVLSLPTTAGTSGQFLQTNGSGVTTWATPGGSGTVTATAGSLTNNAIVLGAGTTDTKVSSGITTDGAATLNLGVAGASVGDVRFFNLTSGRVRLVPTTGALGTSDLTLPARSATVATTVGTLTSGRCVEIDASGNFIQAAAACGTGGGGITSLEGQTGATQTFTDDTNVTIVSGSDAHVITWAGTLAAGRGGTGNGAPAEDQLIVGNGTGYDLKTLPSCSNATTDKLLYNSTTNTFSCGSDQTTGGGSGITNLNTLTGATQTFSKTDDTNVTLTITSTGTDHNFALGFTGTLADARVADNITLTNITQITNRAIGDTTGDLAASRVDDGAVAATQALFSGAGAAAGFRAIADADIPDTITIDLATLATTATTANAGDSATAFFSAGTIEAARLPDLSALNGAVTDAQVPNTITVDLATTATTANAGDSATAFFSSGQIEVARLGSGTPDGTKFLRDDGVFVTPPGTGTINSGVTNIIPKYTAATTLDDSLLSDDATTLTYSGSGGFSLTATGGGFIQFTEGTPPSIVANTVQHAVVADAPAAGTQYLWGATAGSGILRVANSSGVMTVTQDAGVSHLATSTSADLAGVLSDEQGSGGGFVRATSPTLTTPVLGVATATSINGLTITTSTGTLTIPNGVTATGPAASDTLVGRASTDTLTNKTFDTAGTGNLFTSTHKPWLPAAGCNGTTAVSFWDQFTSTPSVPACVTGTNTQKAYLDFPDTAGGFTAHTTIQLPDDFTGVIDADIQWITTATSGNVKWSLSVSCTNTDGTQTDDQAFETPSTVTTAAPGVASRVQTSSISSLTITNCGANDIMHLKLFRQGDDAADTISATARFYGLRLTLKRTQ